MIALSSFLKTLELNPRLDVLQALKAFENVSYVLLLDSAARHRERDSRYSFLTADPVEISRIARVRYGDRPFQLLREWQCQLPKLSEADGIELPPFMGGIAGLMSYELGHAFEDLPSPEVDDFKTPAMLAGLFDWAIVWDHLAGTVKAYVLTLSTARSASMVQNRMDWILDRLGGASLTSEDHEDVCDASDRQPMRPSGRLHQIEPSSEIYSDFTRDEYTAAVRRVVDYIGAGDIFQANLSQRLLTRWPGTA